MQHGHARFILPPLVHLAMRAKMLQPYRARIVGAAEGRVLEFGIGSGLNLPLYGSKVSSVVGIEPSPELLRMARRRSDEAHVPVELLEATAEALPVDDGSIDTVVTDLPYGQLVGSDVALETLYLGILAEATRVIAPGGHLMTVTTRNKLFDDALEPVRQYWRTERRLSLKVPFRSGYIQPTVYSLRKVR